MRARCLRPQRPGAPRTFLGYHDTHASRGLALSGLHRLLGGGGRKDWWGRIDRLGWRERRFAGVDWLPRGGALGGRHFLGLCGASVEVGRGAAGEGRVLMASTRSMVSMGCDCCAL